MKYLFFFGFLFITIILFAGFIKVGKNIIWEIKNHEYKSLIINISILIFGILFYFYVFRPIETIQELFSPFS